MPVGEVLNELVAAVDAACEVDPADLGDGETVVALHRQLARLEAVLTRAVAAFDVGRTWGADGARSAASWVAFSCRLPASAARRRVRVGRALRQMPEVEAAWLAGDIADAHAAPLAAARTPATEEAFSRDEEVLVGEAKRLTHQQFMGVLGYWYQLTDPDGAEADAAAQRDARRLHLSRSFGGSWFLDGRLDPIAGTAVARGPSPHRRRAVRRRVGRGEGAAGRGRHRGRPRPHPCPAPGRRPGGDGPPGRGGAGGGAHARAPVQRAGGL